jgi:hypothetical protein
LTGRSVAQPASKSDDKIARVCNKIFILQF